MDNVNEKWSGDTEIKSTGKWADKTIAELKKARSALKDKEDRTKEETLLIKKDFSESQIHNKLDEIKIV